MIARNLPLLLNLAYVGYNRGVDGDFKPIYAENGVLVKTFCNEFISYVLGGLGYPDFDGLLANDIVARMDRSDSGWITVDPNVAQAHANAGVVVIAGHINSGSHGHVCLILPGVLEKSGSWNMAVPKCVNVGKDVFFGKKVSYAFQPTELPRFYALAEMI